MEHLIILALSTLVIFFLMFLIWVKTKEISFIFGLLIVFLFTILGGWIITIDLIFDNICSKYGFNYYYLFDKMFPVSLDGDYLMAIVFYSLFVIFVELAILVFAAKKNPGVGLKFSPYFFSHWRLIFFVIFFSFSSFFIMRDFLIEAISSGTSAYFLTRYSTDRIPFYTIHQIFIRMALFPLAVGIAVYLSGKKGKYFLGGSGHLIFWSYAVISSVIVAYAALLGNRNELVGAAIIGFLFYIVNAKKISKIGFLTAFIGVIAAVGVIGIIRGSNPSSYLASMKLGTLVNGLASILTTNEIFAAHLSMYGSLHYGIPLVYGYSFISLASSIVPSDLWPDRPQNIYWHYFNHINAVPGQGYVIHHATGWYLNFGLIGIVAGAVLIGWLWAECFNSRALIKGGRYFIYNVFAVLAPTLFISALPTLMRGGLESYKAVALEHFLFPILIVVFSIKQIKGSNLKLSGNSPKNI